MTGHRWTPEAKARVCALYKEGSLSGTAIVAVILGGYGIAATKSAVIGVAFRAGLKARDSVEAQARRKASRAKSNRVARPRPRPVLKAAPAPKPKPKPATKPALAVEAAAPSLRIPIWQIRDGQCRYIADDPRGGSSTYCEHTAQHGSPWCPGHFRICTIPDRGRVSVWIPSRRAA